MCTETTNERTISSETYCSGSHNVDKYVDVTKEVSYDSGETWYFASSSSTLVEANSPDCGYRTRTVSTGTTCSGAHNVDKYQLIKYQESYDYGNTWVTVSSTTVLTVSKSSAESEYLPPISFVMNFHLISRSCLTNLASKFVSEIIGQAEEVFCQKR